MTPLIHAAASTARHDEDSSRHHFKRAILLGASLCALAVPTTAFAQAGTAPEATDVLAEDAGENADGGNAIIVTASRRRDEAVQDVPIALSVISGAQLERRGDYTLGQIQQQVPSLQVFSFNPRNTNINIRGLGSNVALTNDGLENGVGFYIDNVYYGRVGQSQFDLVDLDRIEVLRGPQGTLFGKNTTAGVINITSRKPSFDPELSAEATLGNYGYYQVRGSASAPIVADKLAVRVSGALTERNGFLWNDTTKRDAQDYYNATVRGQLLFQANDDVSLRVIGDYSKQKQNFVLNSFIDFHDTYANGAPIANDFFERLARFPNATVPSFEPFDRQGYANSHYQANMESYGVSGELNWDLGGAQLTSITAYRWWDWNPANDGDGTNLSVITKAQQLNRQRQFSQEVRVASTGDSRLNYVAGAFYFWQIIRGYGTTTFGSDAALWNVPQLNQTVANAALNGFEVNSTSTPETKSLAAFGQLDWEVTDSLSLTGGLRFTHEKKQGEYEQLWVAGADLSGLTAQQAATALGLRQQFGPAVPKFSTGFTDDSLSGLISATYRVAPDAILYASYSRGNKSGGLNLTALPAGVEPDVEPEKVDAYEIGFKSQWLDRRLTFNAAGFWTEITDYQTAITEQSVDTVSYRQYIANIPKVRSRGVEGDLTFAVSPNFSVTTSGTYTDAEYVKYENAPQAVENLNLPGTSAQIQDLSGERLPGIPKFAWSIGADGWLPLGVLGDRELEAYGHADYSHRSSFNTTATNSAWGEVQGYGLANARIGLRTADGLLDVSLWAKNLFDKDYFSNLSAANTGVVTGQLGEPRTYGLTLRTKL
jgi:iron complex outermembrane receptor protein